MHEHTRAGTNARSHACMLAYMHTRTHARSLARLHTHMSHGSCDNFILGYWATADMEKKTTTVEFTWDIAEARWKGDSKISKFGWTRGRARGSGRGHVGGADTRADMRAQTRAHTHAPGMPRRRRRATRRSRVLRSR